MITAFQPPLGADKNHFGHGFSLSLSTLEIVD